MTGEQVRAARALLGLAQHELADRAGIGRRVLIEFESGRSIPHARNQVELRRVLEAAGVELVEREDGAIGVFLSRKARLGL
jgi:transcriptional regulator with XRE-family HTH domain